MPYFFLIVLGVILRKSGAIPLSFLKGANRFVFKIALPFQLFYTIAGIEGDRRSGGFMLYVLAVTVISFLVIWLVTELIYKDKALVGTLVQGAFRGNYILLGVPLVYSVLGDAAVKTAALASVVAVPAYNILSVFILTLRGESGKSLSLSGLMKDIFTNPLIIGIICGFPFMIFNVKIPFMFNQTLVFIGQTATPLGLLSIGGMLNFADATARLRPAIYSSVIKNLLLPVAVMTASYFLGYRGNEMMTLLVLSAAPVAISSYAMASEMGGDSALASNIMIITTFASAFVLALGIYLLKTFSLI